MNGGPVESPLLAVAVLGLAAGWVLTVIGWAGRTKPSAGGSSCDQPPPADSGFPREPVDARAVRHRSSVRQSSVRRPFWVALGVALVAQTGLLLVWSFGRGALAVYDQAEFLFATSWVVAAAVVFFVRRGAPWAVATVALTLALVLLGGAILAPARSGEVRPASLTSIWLLLHIVVSIVAYGAFTITFAAAVVTLARRSRRVPPSGVAPVERLGYQAAVLGFPFMTMVLLTGALWAKYVWGRYWAWDPIEAWALVTWVVYAAYLHAHYSRRWAGARAAWLAVTGFACVLATYLFFTHLSL